MSVELHHQRIFALTMGEVHNLSDNEPKLLGYSICINETFTAGDRPNKLLLCFRKITHPDHYHLSHPEKDALPSWHILLVKPSFIPQASIIGALISDMVHHTTTSGLLHLHPILGTLKEIDFQAYLGQTPRQWETNILTADMC